MPRALGPNYKTILSGSLPHLKEVKNYCRACYFYFRHKRVADAKAGLPLSLSTTTRSNQLESIDYVGPVTETENGNKFIITIIDHHSRFTAAVPCKAATAEEAAKGLFHGWISNFDIPECLLSDRG